MAWSDIFFWHYQEEKKRRKKTCLEAKNKNNSMSVAGREIQMTLFNWPPSNDWYHFKWGLIINFDLFEVIFTTM